MNLHRVGKEPDWAHVGPSDWNIWQGFAVRTNGWLTPGNVVTLAGVVMSAIGLVLLARNSFWSGLLWLGVGRVMDVVDGWVADKTSTKSPLGEILDAGFDKLIIALTLVVFAGTNIAPWWLMVILIIPHVIISLYSGRALGQHRVLHPSKFGKYSNAAAWVGLLGFVIMRGLKLQGFSLVGLLTYSAVAVSLWFSTLAVLGYIHQAHAAKN